MSQYPQQVLADTQVAWDPHANGAARSTFTRRGTVADIPPGSALEAAYGGTGNLSGVIGFSNCGDGTVLSKAALAN